MDQPFDNHNGGTIAFGADDLLYMGFGDGGDSNDPDDNAQDGTTLLGKMIRIDVAFGAFTDDYEIPPSNPFASPSDDIRDEIWSFGLRNPFRFSFDRTEGDLRSATSARAHSKRSTSSRRAPGAETTAGTSSGRDVQRPRPRRAGLRLRRFADPVHAYAQFGPCNAVTAAVVYRGSLAALQGQYFFADYCSNDIWSFVWDGAGGTVGPVDERTGDFEPDAGTISDIVGFGEDGAGNMLIIDTGGEVFHIAPEARARASCSRSAGRSSPRLGSAQIGPHPSDHRPGWIPSAAGLSAFDHRDARAPDVPDARARGDRAAAALRRAAVVRCRRPARDRRRAPAPA